MGLKCFKSEKTYVVTGQDAINKVLGIPEGEHVTNIWFNLGANRDRTQLTVTTIIPAGHTTGGK